ncbi:MAG: hypothetical protein Q4G45_00490 [Actinomycetia bacterium]|nr:hypothetical protein [Actinomycetes bacterium]
MTPAIWFIDTSVLTNLLPVPGRDQDSAAVRDLLQDRTDRGDRFILPITSVIETGNFVAQIPDGHVRRSTAQRFEHLLRLVANGKSPWIFHDVPWNAQFLQRLLDGAGTEISYLNHAIAEVGMGDLCILTERDHYHRRTRVRAKIWTLDHELAAHG